MAALVKTVYKLNVFWGIFGLSCISKDLSISKFRVAYSCALVCIIITGSCIQIYFCDLQGDREMIAVASWLNFHVGNHLGMIVSIVTLVFYRDKMQNIIKDIIKCIELTSKFRSYSYRSPGSKYLTCYVLYFGVVTSTSRSYIDIYEIVEYLHTIAVGASFGAYHLIIADMFASISKELLDTSKNKHIQIKTTTWISGKELEIFNTKVRK